MYPLAMAWVESECKDSWAWFLTSLTDQIGASADHNWVFIFDRQKVEIKQRSFDYEAIVSDNGIREVTYYNKHFVVNVYGRSCTCKEWDLTGIPCEHAYATIMHNGKEAVDYVHPFYTIQFYKKTYKYVIIPILEKNLWLETGELLIEPPELRRRPSRPRKLRRKGPDERVDSSMVTRRGTVLHCSNCKQAGHNRKTCKQPVNTRQTNKNVNEQDGGSNQSTVQSDITTGRGVPTNTGRGTRRGVSGRRAKRVAREKRLEEVFLTIQVDGAGAILLASMIMQQESGGRTVQIVIDLV
ncbi:hypothetical protein ACH5RR_008557 [Cinchona calisaya]|uniref:SWIM-type domain-containing protein n=1 Tax=Cinchona calisaya TaxID=153742 RepID=A0ABD3ABP2_9GENT